MSWKTVSVRDRGFWTDHHSEDGRYLIAQGWGEYERKQLGLPWAVFDISDDKRWITVGYYPTLDAAKQAVTVKEAPQPRLQEAPETAVAL
jgi:hypothetical protein